MLIKQQDYYTGAPRTGPNKRPLGNERFYHRAQSRRCHRLAAGMPAEAADWMFAPRPRPWHRLQGGLWPSIACFREISLFVCTEKVSNCFLWREENKPCVSIVLGRTVSCFIKAAAEEGGNVLSSHSVPGKRLLMFYSKRKIKTSSARHFSRRGIRWFSAQSVKCNHSFRGWYKGGGLSCGRGSGSGRENTNRRGRVRLVLMKRGPEMIRCSLYLQIWVLTFAILTQIHAHAYKLGAAFYPGGRLWAEFIFCEVKKWGRRGQVRLD